MLSGGAAADGACCTSWVIVLGLPRHTRRLRAARPGRSGFPVFALGDHGELDVEGERVDHNRGDRLSHLLRVVVEPGEYGGFGVQGEEGMPGQAGLSSPAWAARVQWARRASMAARSMTRQ